MFVVHYGYTPESEDTSMSQSTAYVAGTFDTKSAELMFMAERIKASGVTVSTIDLSTSNNPSTAEAKTTDVKATDVASFHPEGKDAVFTGDRGSAVAGMAKAFELWAIEHQSEIGGLISAGGTGGTALSTPAMRALPIGTPKVMVSTVASGDVSPYVGPADITMVYSVTDVQGLNRISTQVLGNAASALAGMVKFKPEAATVADAKPGLGLMMFGVTTPAVQAISANLDNEYECFVFHATGVGGRSMEKLVDGGLLDAVVDLTTTEVCDMMFGGILAADEDRFGAIIRTQVPYVGSVGALDMVNFGAPDTVPDRYKDRLFYEHNPMTTLMRTTPEENAKMGKWIASRLNLMQGPVRFLLPEGGVSALDAPDAPFWNVEARDALYAAIEGEFKAVDNRELVRLPHHINDAEFADTASTLLRKLANKS